MVDEPALTPVTKPVEVIVATAVFDDTQGFDVAAVLEPVNWVVETTQTLNVPLIVGDGFTVMVLVAVQPLKLK